MYEYKCKIIKVVDGDTVDVDIDLGFGVWLKDERVRIMGIDTPESRTRDKTEKKFGLASKAKLKSLKGKFGRILGDFQVGARMVTKILCEEGYAVPYFGGSKEEVQALHQKNREILVKKGIVKL